MAIMKWKNSDLYDPWGNLKSLQDDINDLFNVDRFPATKGLFDRNVSPPMDVIENEHDFTVICELPGLDHKDIDVSIASNILTIKGQKKDEKKEKNGKYFKRETWSGNFQRTLSLPESVDSDKIAAKFTDGILKIDLPKKEEAKPKQISVNVK
jgi:HSP20 family protein